MVVLSTPNDLVYCPFYSHIIQFSPLNEQKQIPQTFRFNELGLGIMSIYKHKT